MEGLAIAALIEAIKLASSGLTDQRPYRAAIKMVKVTFPVLKKEMSASFDAFLKDSNVSHTLADAVSSHQPPDVISVLADRFVALCTVPNLSPETATDIIETFAAAVSEALLEPGSSTWLLHEAIRIEGHKIRMAVRREMGQLDHSAAVSRDTLAVSAAVDPPDHDPEHLRAESGPWDHRLQEAKRLFDSADLSSAHAVYDQILNDANRDSVSDADLLYRLHYNIGACATALHDHDQAAHSFGRALRVRPTDPNANAMLAQTHLLRGHRSKAEIRAKDVVLADPDNAIAWLVLAKVADHVCDVGDLSESCRTNPHVLLALADRQIDDGRHTDALATTRVACRFLGTDVQCLVTAAELLLYLCAPVFGESMSDEDTRLANGILTDALEATDTQPKSPYRPRILASRAGLRFRAGDLDGGTDDARRAYELSPGSKDSTIAFAHALAVTEQFAEALHVLDRLPGSKLDATALALRAQLVADTEGSDAEVAECIKQSLDAAPAELPIAIKVNLAEVATRRRLLETSRQLVDAIKDHAPKYMVDLFRARLCRAVADGEGALGNYSRALASAPTSVRQGMAFESAFCAGSLGQYERMIATIDHGGLDGAPHEVWQGYCEALTQLGRWDKIAEVVEGMWRTVTLPPIWLRHLRAVVAIRSDDFPKAIQLLQGLRGECEGEQRSDVELRLAYALWQNGEREDSVALARGLARKAALSPAMQGELAKLLSWAGDHVGAIRLAYMAMRSSAPSTDYDSLYAMVFFRSPDDLGVKRSPSRIGPDTWISLESDTGDKTELWLLSDAFPCKSHLDVPAESDEAQEVIGRSIGDIVQIRPMDMVPTQYRVTQVATIWVQAYREALARSVGRASSSRAPIQSIPLGDIDTVAGFSVLIGMLEHDRDRSEALEDLYQAGRLPLSVLSTDRGAFYMDAYQHASTLPSGMLVEDGSAESIQASQIAVNTNDSVVLHISSLVTLRAIDMLSLPSKMFDRLIVPVSLKQELEAEVDRTSFDIERGGAKRLGLFENTITATTVPPEELGWRKDELRRLIQWIRDDCLQAPRPAESLSEEGEKLRNWIGASSYDACALVDDDTPLYADDLVLRRLAHGEKQAPTFASYSMVASAMDADVINAKEGWRAMSKLIDLGHQFIPVSSDFIYHCLVTDGYHLGDRSRKALQRLVSGSVESTAPVFARLIRKLSTSIVGGGTIGAVVRYVLALLHRTGPEGRATILRYRAATRGTLLLHPLVRDVVDAQFDVYL